MEEFFKQTEVAAANGIWYLALFASLTIPDICGAMATSDGMATKPRYIEWFDHYVGPAYNPHGLGRLAHFTGADCYFLRCSMLHQGSTVKPESRFDRFVFFPRGNHNNAILDSNFGAGKISLLTLDIPRFCADLVSGGRTWLAEVKDSGEFKVNFERFIQARPDIPGQPGIHMGWVIT